MIIKKNRVKDPVLFVKYYTVFYGIINDPFTILDPPDLVAIILSMLVHAAV
jgi:hypothetical protein